MEKSSIVDYRSFRFNKLNTTEFKHLKYLFFWPLYGLMFLTVERLWIRSSYYPMYCPLDDLIPLCEYFLIPYMFWFVFLVGMHIYTLLFDTKEFERFMKFIIVSYTIAILTYIIFPNCQELRPVVFERNNIFTQFLAGFYQFDTNTNVCPSIHVIGSVAVAVSAWHTKHFGTKMWRWVFGISAFFISISTVFLKQHSMIDVIAAVPVCFIAYWAAYKIEWKNPFRKKA